MATRCSRLTETARCAAIVSGCIASVADAQAPVAADAMYRALEIVATVEETGSCDIALHGVPALDEITERWLIAYSGVGPECDDSSALLQREGLSSNIAFFRRPNADEVKVLMGRMRASVRKGFDCQISFKDEPRFDDVSNLWTVRFKTVDTGQKRTSRDQPDAVSIALALLDFDTSRGHRIGHGAGFGGDTHGSARRAARSGCRPPA